MPTNEEAAERRLRHPVDVDQRVVYRRQRLLLACCASLLLAAGHLVGEIQVALDFLSELDVLRLVRTDGDDLEPAAVAVEAHARRVAVAQLATENGLGERSPDVRADEAVEGASSPARLVPVLGEPVARSLLDEEADAALGCGGRVVERVLNFGKAQVDNLGDGFGRQRVEDDLLVEAVQLRVELRQWRFQRRGKLEALTSSGGYMLCTRARTRSFALSVTVPSGSVAPSSARMSDPMLLVKMMVAASAHCQYLQCTRNERCQTHCS